MRNSGARAQNQRTMGASEPALVDDPALECKVTLGEMIALADADLDDAFSMKMARILWERPNTAAEDRAIMVRRAMLTTLQMFAMHEEAVRKVLRSSSMAE
jgi:hypothetical protein